MKAWTLLKDKLVLKRKEDEAFYAAALNEFSTGQIRPGLMAKAMAKCKGNESEARAEYINLLTQAIRDDHYLHTRSQEEKERAAKLLQEKKTGSWVEDKEPQKKQPNPQKRWRWDEILSYSIVAVMIVLFAAYKSGLSIDPRHYLSKYQQANPTPTPQLPQKTSYQVLLERYEARYPQINPNSPYYNDATTQRIAARITALKNSGYSPEQALGISIEEAFKASATPNPLQPPA
ncbi:hypothetical protein [Pseudomonas sp. Gutcm_11s]|uniref:hypothetical protein n=1 Tax=Pseudomonas sp. Gutcm_11s TaxID=3026088 RepID=UPI00235EE843|nr:hypothetical protein [Pseudomonas sp. Gutcm_11s]MDD0842372.1 hypothetical protein [Pseudomonas sp. Gutcm_11s]